MYMLVAKLCASLINAALVLLPGVMKHRQIEIHRKINPTIKSCVTTALVESMYRKERVAGRGF